MIPSFLQFFGIFDIFRVFAFSRFRVFGFKNMFSVIEYTK